MDLRTWLADSLTGDVLARVHMAPGSRFTSVIGGGRMAGEVALSPLRDRDGGDDTSALLTVLQALQGGRHTILATVGSETVGEWLVLNYTRDHDAATAPVNGIEWDDYPQFRSIHTDFVHDGSVDAGVIHAAAIEDVYNMFQPDDQQIVAVTAPSFGQGMSMNRPVRSGYYSDVLADIDAMGWAEWRIVPTCTWANGVPTKVTRTVQYAQPILSATHPDPLIKSSGRGGNLTSFVRDYDFPRIAGTVIGWGAGKGEKQRFAMAQDGGHLSRGHIAITRNVHFQGEYSNAQLQAKTEAVLDVSADPWAPAKATIDTRRLSTLPVVGGVHDVTVAPSSTFPEGGSWQMRVGQITWTYGSPLVDVEMEEL